MCFFFRMRLRRFLISEPMAGGNASRARARPAHQVGPSAEGKVDRVVRGWCNGSTGSFGVPSRGSKPRPRARRAESRRDAAAIGERQYREHGEWVPTPGGRGAGGGRGHPHALGARPRCSTRCAAARCSCTCSTRSSALPLERIVVVVGHGAERVTKTLQEQLVDRRAGRVRRAARPARAPATPRASALTAFADDPDDEDDVIVVPRRRRRCCGPRRWPASPPSTAGRRRGHAAHRRARRPHRLRAHRARRPGPRSTGSSSSPTAHAEELEIDEVNPSIYCFRRSLLAPGAAPAQPRERAGRVLPHRRRGGAAPDRAPRARGVEADDATDALGVNDRAQLADGRGRAAAPHQHPLDARRRRHDRSRAHLRRHRGGARTRRAAAPGHDPRGPHRRRHAAR